MGKRSGTSKVAAGLSGTSKVVGTELETGMIMKGNVMVLEQGKRLVQVTGMW